MRSIPALWGNRFDLDFGQKLVFAKKEQGGLDEGVSSFLCKQVDLSR
ncbi:hypothetical protein KR51_00011970 [Rubidibacter lacunae KORDI 51-2]|uniref:Uncharacterized protein n=1 Tax=Rubidibacter lacunae KORDI 51-2 TaxID=582515 RepID=U5DC65_9CHRO|nr:hypothetical protein KR51_00011970 [Rubidibacter lacunae KORDI 51-2]